MSLNINIDKILTNKNDVFYKIIEEIDAKSLNNAKKELEVQYNLNVILIDAIEFSVAKLKSEENLLSQMLYSTFGIGKAKNKRRVELISFGSQLKNEITQLERDRTRINFHYDKIVSSLQNLTTLSEDFGKKMHCLIKKDMEKRCQKYLKKIYVKMDEHNDCKKKLSLKNIYLESCIFKYKELLKTIPRHHELKEERSRYLLPK